MNAASSKTRPADLRLARGIPKSCRSYMSVHTLGTFVKAANCRAYVSMEPLPVVATSNIASSGSWVVFIGREGNQPALSVSNEGWGERAWL